PEESRRRAPATRGTPSRSGPSSCPSSWCGQRALHKGNRTALPARTFSVSKPPVGTVIRTRFCCLPLIQEGVPCSIPIRPPPPPPPLPAFGVCFAGTAAAVPQLDPDPSHYLVLGIRSVNLKNFSSTAPRQLVSDQLCASDSFFEVFRNGAASCDPVCPIRA